MSLQEQRQKMVSRQLAARGIQDPRVLDAYLGEDYRAEEVAAG